MEGGGVNEFKSLSLVYLSQRVEKGGGEESMNLSHCREGWQRDG